VFSAEFLAPSLVKNLPAKKKMVQKKSQETITVILPSQKGHIMCLSENFRFVFGKVAGH
jgi:hypothetical protein